MLRRNQAIAPAPQDERRQGQFLDAVRVAARRGLPCAQHDRVAIAFAQQQRTSLENDYLDAVQRYLTALAHAEAAAGNLPAHP